MVTSASGGKGVDFVEVEIVFSGASCGSSSCRSGKESGSGLYMLVSSGSERNGRFVIFDNVEIFVEGTS